MVDKFIMGLSELTPAFLASQGFTKDQQQIDTQKSDFDTVIDSGLIGLMSKKLYNNEAIIDFPIQNQEKVSGQPKMRYVPRSIPDQIIDIRDQDREYSDVIHDEEDRPLMQQEQRQQEQQQDAQEVAVGDDDDPPDRRDFNQQANRGDPPVLRLIEEINRFDWQQLEKLLQIIQAILSTANIVLDRGKDGIIIEPRPHSVQEEEVLKKYNEWENKKPIHESCKRHIYFENGKLKEFVVCRQPEYNIYGRDAF